MPGRYNFSSRFARGSDGWFTIGSLNVNTTMGLVLLGGIGIVLSALVPGFTGALALNRNAVAGLEVWRLVTWIVPNSVSLWTLVLLYMVYAFGSQLENQVGRQAMLRLVGALTLVPAVVFCVVALLTGSLDSVAGLNIVELGLLVAFAAQFPWVRFFFGIPAPVMVGIFVALEILQARAALPQLAMVISAVVMALLGIRAMGYAQDVHQIPRLTIPGLTPSSGSGRGANRLSVPKRNRDSGTRAGKSGARKGGLRSVPTPSSVPKRSEAASSPEIDAILDQINETGFDSLNDEQKAALNQYSQRLRQDRDR